MESQRQMGSCSWNHTTKRTDRGQKPGLVPKSWNELAAQLPAEQCRSCDTSAEKRPWGRVCMWGRGASSAALRGPAPSSVRDAVEKQLGRKLGSWYPEGDNFLVILIKNPIPK